MITELTGVPAGVIGFETSGKLRAEDYRDVLLPAIEAAAKAGDVRLMIVISSFEGMTPSALWQDLRMGLEHLRAWKRTAVVTDIGWVTQMTALFGWMTPGQTRHFPL